MVWVEASVNRNEKEKRTERILDISKRPLCSVNQTLLEVIGRVGGVGAKKLKFIVNQSILIVFWKGSLMVEPICKFYAFTPFHLLTIEVNPIVS